MIYLKEFDSHASYESELNGGVDISLPNVSYCEDVKDVHYTPYNLVRFYVDVMTLTHTVSIYTDDTHHEDVTVNEVNKWYTYVLPKDKGLYKIEGVSVNKVVVKADINESGRGIIPSSTVEASFKGSNTSKVTDIRGMFNGCSSLTSLDVSSFDTSNVTNMAGMFYNCNGLTSLYLSNFKTNNVTNMTAMFANCSNLKSLDLSGWVISDGTNMDSMFNGCDALISIRMAGCSKSTMDKIASVKPRKTTIEKE